MEKTIVGGNTVACKLLKTETLPLLSPYSFGFNSKNVTKESSHAQLQSKISSHLVLNLVR
ncbi:MAG: hypothetical protein ACK5KP_09870 [Paludibacteraceae bacterium]